MVVITEDGKVFGDGTLHILTFGLTEAENAKVEASLPSNRYTLYATKCPTDLIALPATAVIFRAEALDNDNREMLISFYTETIEYSADTVIWLGQPKPPKPLQRILKCYNDFSEIQDSLKYLLLDAHKKQKKSSEFSNSVMCALKILSAIRNHPGITTQELAERCEISPRSVLRYIQTLRCSGEWIEYDTAVHGWKLFHGISILFGDCWGGDVE